MTNWANWICNPHDIGTVSPEFRKRHTCRGKVASAKATVTALGVYTLSVNGQKAGNYVLAPYWTSYNHQLQEQVYDITDLVREENTFSLLLGKGWAVGEVGWQDNTRIFSDHVAVIAHIRITYCDGGCEHIVTDGSWEVYTSHILDSEIYHGETVDLTAPCSFVGMAAEDVQQRNIVPMIGEHVVERERVAAAKLIITPRGERVIDFGQNLAGYAEVRVRGSRGDRVVISHAEVLDRDGNFYTDNLRSARCRNTYVLGDAGEYVFKPSFTFQGFRYIRLDEYPGQIDPEDFTAVAVYSDIRRTGDFRCGHDKLNRLYSNILWGQRSNFLDVPTDCPQRDERLGWTGDAEVFCRTAAINYDVQKFFRKWLKDMAYEQLPDGGINMIVPWVSLQAGRISTAWADAAVICPWEMYLAYGNLEDLREAYPMMRKWVEYMHGFGEEEYLFVGGSHFGDWLAMDAGEGQYVGATQTDLIASAFFAYSTALLIRAGKALGEDVTAYETLYANVRNAFRAAFMRDGLPVLYPKADALSADRPVLGMTQTAITLILRFGLCEEAERRGLVDALVKLIDENGGCMTTGFVGTPHILHALTENGRVDRAYDLLLQEKAPSWLFSVNQGATTIWEHWDSQKEDGSFWSTDMNSFNHYAYGSVFDWIFATTLGIRVPDDGAGYRKVTVAPQPDARLGFAEGSIDTRFGKLCVRWCCVPGGVRYEITVPAGMEVTLCLPGRKEKHLTGGSWVMLA